LEFLEEMNELPTECERLKSIEWPNDLAFLVDVRPTGHLNHLNLKLHGRLGSN